MNDKSYAMEIEQRLRERAYRRALGDPEQDWVAREQWRASIVDLAGAGHVLRAAVLTVVGWVLR
jgi:hypothetical protein